MELLFEGGNEPHRVIVAIDEREAAVLRADPDAEEVGSIILEKMRVLEARGGRYVEEEIVYRLSSWRFPYLAEDLAAVPPGSFGSTADERSAGVSKSRSLLSLLHRLLPAELREDALDEWMDEIETAAAEGQPVRRRALSIAVRSLPVMVWRSRWPARARGGGC